MAFAPPVKAKVSSNLAKSTWTPANNPEANNQVFGERRELIMKWFQKWHESQKKIVVEDILKSLSSKHLISVSETLKGKFPQEKHDFTKVFPRVLTLYVFSYLDPRTLCRCSQVSWYWNYLTEMDCLWRPKCLKFGWYPVYQPSPFEEKVWKRFYVTTVHELNYAKAKAAETKAITQHETQRPDTARSAMSRISTARSHASSASGILRGPSTPSSKKPLPGPKWEPPPWKGSDKKPTDTMRYNYLDNNAKKGKSKASGVPGSRPSSRRSHRPHSATAKSVHLDTGAPFISKSTQKQNLPPEHNKADLTDSQTVGLSPRLDKNLKLPQYNGHTATVPLSKDIGNIGAASATVQYGANESITGRQALNLTQRYASPPATKASPTSYSNSPRPDGSAPYSAPDISKLSMDAGTMPKPVVRLSTERVKKKSPEKEKDADEDSRREKIIPAQINKSLSTNNTDDLKGQGWKSPPHQNSDEDE